MAEQWLHTADRDGERRSGPLRFPKIKWDGRRLANPVRREIPSIVAIKIGREVPSFADDPQTCCPGFPRRSPVGGTGSGHRLCNKPLGRGGLPACRTVPATPGGGSPATLTVPSSECRGVEITRRLLGFWSGCRTQ